MTNLTTYDCPCGQKAREVIWAEKKIRRGWYCRHCGNFIKALARERVIEGPPVHDAGPSGALTF